MKQVTITAVLAAGVIGCATVQGLKTVGPGPFRVGSSYEVNLGYSWVKLSNTGSSNVASSALTIDGPRLNVLLLAEAVKEGDTLFSPASKEQVVPRYRRGMTELEIVEFVSDSLAVLGYQNIQAHNLRPAPFGTLHGLRFDLTATTTDALEIAATGIVAEGDKGLNMILYVAPREYYYDRHASEVESVIASARDL